MCMKNEQTWTVTGGVQCGTVQIDSRSEPVPRLRVFHRGRRGDARQACIQTNRYDLPRAATFLLAASTMPDQAQPANHRPADPQRQEYELAPIDSITPHPRNPNQGDVGSIRESIDVNGFYGACIVQKSTRFILAGEHRWRAEKERQQAYVPVLFVDVDDETALRILLADNGTRRGARTQEKLVGEILESLRVRQGTGYKPPDIQALLKKARPVPSYLAAAAQKAQAPSAAAAEAKAGESPLTAAPDPATAPAEPVAVWLVASDAAGEGELPASGPAPEAPEPDAHAAEALLRAAELAAEEKALPSLDEAPEEVPEPAPEPAARVGADTPAKPRRDPEPAAASEALTLRPRIGLRGEARHPLAVVLDNDGSRRWSEWKDRVGARKDTDALLLALDALREVVLPWEAEEDAHEDADDDAVPDEPGPDADPDA